jgi:hypothetical protein
VSDADESGFLARWARRKAIARSGPAKAAPEAAQAPQGPADALPRPQVERSHSVDGLGESGSAAAAGMTEPASAPPADPAPLPTLDEVARLTRSSDYSRFVQPGVTADVRNAALRQLFTDPHFNVMDGLDTYIDDYGKPDPIPLAMLRKMRQSKLLGLFDDEDENENENDAAGARASPDGAAPRAVAESAPTDCPAPPPGASPIRPDDDADLRLQQDDGAGCAGPAPGARA